ncbi:MAG TPA: GNAT family N-acetyltransferase [Ruminococcaceae bacterium]|jgi:RimJ/RimL family protein N-acetyltransferase|nr:GNAT family N-acetyltransferase [Oscillospiraceae bacterium]
MNSVPEILGKDLILRRIQLSDIEDRFKIGRHHEFVHMCGGESLLKPEFPDKSVWVNWYESNKDTEYSWIIEKNGHCIGSAGFHHISTADNSATYRIGIFDPLYQSKGVGTEVTKLLLKYGFEQMKWHRIDLRVLEYNLRGIRCYEKCGFKKDGMLRENAFVEGKYYSDIVMSILDYEYFTKLE